MKRKKYLTIVILVAIILIISLLVVITIYFNKKKNISVSEEDNQIIIGEGIPLDEIDFKYTKYDGIHNGNKVRAMFAEITSNTLCEPGKERIPTVIFKQNNESEEIKYEEDIHIYVRALNNLRMSINPRENFNINISYNSYGFASEIIVEKQ